MAFSVLLACMSSSLAVFREATLWVWEYMPDITLWTEKKWSRGGEKWGGERNEKEKGGGGVGEGRQTKAGKHNTKKI